MKRTIALCLALMLLMVAFLTACDGSTTTSSGTSDTTSDTSSSTEDPTLPYLVTTPTTFEFWSNTSAANRPTEQSIIDKVTAANPNIICEVVYGSGIMDKIIAADLAGGADLPGLAGISSDSTYALAVGGLAEPLGPRLQAFGVDVDDYSQGLMQAFSWDGEQYLMPFLNSCCIWFYNKDIAAAEGIVMPDTWNQIDAFLKKATVEGRAAMGFAGFNSFYYESLFINNGVKVINADGVTTDINDDLAVGMTTKMREWVDAGYITWYHGTTGSNSMRAAFIAKETFGCTHSPGIYMTYVEGCDFEVGIWFQPGGTYGRTTEAGGNGLCIPKKVSEGKKNAGFQVMIAFTEVENNVALARVSGYLLVRESTINDPAGQAYLAEFPEINIIMQGLDNIIPRPRGPGADTAREEWDDAMAKIMVEKANIAATLAQCQVDMENILRDAQ